MYLHQMIRYDACLTCPMNAQLQKRNSRKTARSFSIMAIEEIYYQKSSHAMYIPVIANISASLRSGPTTKHTPCKSQQEIGAPLLLSSKLLHLMHHWRLHKFVPKVPVFKVPHPGIVFTIKINANWMVWRLHFVQLLSFQIIMNKPMCWLSSST